MRGCQLSSSQSMRNSGRSVKGGDIVTVPEERGKEEGRVKRTKVGYSYSWVTVEWSDGTMNDCIASTVKRVPGSKPKIKRKYSDFS